MLTAGRLDEDAHAFLFALAAYDAGIATVPLALDGSKSPSVPWKRYQTQRPDPRLLRSWYIDQGLQGVAYICGAVSGHLQMVEFETWDLWEAFKDTARAAGLADLVERIEAGYLSGSPGGGVHALFRCEETGTNTKLASRPKRPEEKRHPNDNVQVLVETREEGGLTIEPPSAGGVHPTGRPYRQVRGGVASIATITPEERRELFTLARSFDNMPKTAPQEPRAASLAGTGRPGDDFNERVNWSDLLSDHGWVQVYRRGGTTYWRRPGKDRGVSATTNHAGSALLYVFTSSTAFEPERSYTKFGAYATLEHGGDFRAAIRALRERGYGAPPPPPFRVIDGGQAGSGGGSQNNSDGAAGDDNPFRTRLTEAGNAEDFARRYGNQVRFDHRRKRWLLRDPGQHRWLVDPDEQVRRLALEATRARFHEAASIEDLKERTEVASWAIKSESRSRLSATLDIAQSLHPIADAGDQWDTEPWLLGCPNGVVNLRTGELQPGIPDDRITMTTGIPYDPAALATRWLQFLVEVFGDPDMIDYVQRVAGYCLSGDMRAQQWWLLYGRGGNGKSVFLRAIANVLGDYFADVPFATFARGAGERDTYALALMENRRLVIASESGDTARLNTERIKAITGGDPQTARRPYEDYVTFSPMCKLMLTANHRPVVTDGTFAFWRRVRLIAFERTFEGERADDRLDDVLAGEAPGILAWAVQGCLAWQARGLTAPDAVLAATKDYQVESDPLAGWIAERCTPDPDARHWGSELYQDYIAWCEEQHIRERERLTNTAFGRKLGERFKKSMTKGRATWWGLRLNGVEGVEGFTPNSTTSKVPPARSEVVKNDPKPSTPSTPRRVCIHCGDLLPDEVTGLYCPQHSSYAFTSEPEGYDSSPLWDDMPPIDDQEDDDPWTR